TTDTFAKVGYLVHGKPRFYSYTIEMAQAAGLANSPTWKAHRPAMLRARTISAVCRMEFPEVIGGMYVAGELGEPVKVDDATGEVTSYDYEISEPTAPAAPQIQAPAPQESRENAMRRLHAVAAANGFTHDDLHRWAIDRGKKSLSEMGTAPLITMANKIENET